MREKRSVIMILKSSFKLVITKKVKKFAKCKNFIYN